MQHLGAVIAGSRQTAILFFKTLTLPSALLENILCSKKWENHRPHLAFFAVPVAVQISSRAFYLFSVSAKHLSIHTLVYQIACGQHWRGLTSACSIAVNSNVVFILQVARLHSALPWVDTLLLPWFCINLMAIDYSFPFCTEIQVTLYPLRVDKRRPQMKYLCGCKTP